MNKYLLIIFASLALASCGPDKGASPLLLDLSADTSIQTIINEGTETLYNGHPTTVTMPDGSIVCAWSRGHGGSCDFFARSSDGGQHWSIRENIPEWAGMRNCPSLYLMTDPQGVLRLFCFSGTGDGMMMSYSEDGGESWTPAQNLGKPCVMAFSSIVRLKDGRYMGFYHRGNSDEDRSPLSVWRCISEDGGLSWGEPVCIAAVEGKDPCEPCAFRSPNGKEILCIMRENTHKGHSLFMTSRDEGRSWSEPRETSWDLTGDRHVAKYLPDGRLVICFRDTAPESTTRGHFMAWTGRYKDIVKGRPGQKRIKLLHSHAGWDCGYPGVEILPDGEVLAVTYVKMAPGEKKHSLVAVRFRP